jgi:tight adherence protein C
MSLGELLAGEVSEWLMLGAIFVLVASGVYSLLYRASQRRPREDCAAGAKPSQAELILGDWTPALAAQVPVGAEVGAELRKELRAAGYYRPTALMEYAAVRSLLVIAPLIAAGLIALLVEPEQMAGVLIGGGVGALLGFSVPRLVLHFRGQARVRALEAGLPLAVDMLTLCLSAGQNLLTAFRRVSREMGAAHRVLAEELAIVRAQAELRSLTFALEEWSARVPSAEVRNLAVILTQAERLGTDSAAALAEYASNLRTGARQKAEALANRTLFWMLFPTILCLWIPAAIMLIGPALLEFREQRRSTVEEWKQTRLQLEGLQSAPASVNGAAQRSAD